MKRGPENERCSWIQQQQPQSGALSNLRIRSMSKTSSEAEISSKDLTNSGLRARFQLDESNSQYRSRHFRIGLPRMNPRVQGSYSCRAPMSPVQESECQKEGLEKSKLLYRWGGLLLAILIKRRNYYSGDLDQFMIHMVLVLGEIKAMNVAADLRPRSLAPPSTARGVNALTKSSNRSSLHFSSAIYDTVQKFQEFPTSVEKPLFIKKGLDTEKIICSEQGYSSSSCSSASFSA